MTIERLAHPEWLVPVLWILALTGLALSWARLRARRMRRLLLGEGFHWPRRRFESDAALLIALAAIAAGLLGPRIGERTQRFTSSGVDVVFAIDVSRSMGARDLPPSRLDRARRGVAELIARLRPADRAALVAFAGRGVLLSPLTPDRGALLEMIAGLDTELIAPPSSNLGSGLRAALEAFEPGGERPAVVFMLSDD